MASLKRNLILVFLAWLPVLGVAEALPDGPHLVVSAEGEVEAAPDIAMLNLQVSETRDTAEAAKKEVDGRTQRVINAAKEQGIVEENIRASQIRVYPDYEWDDGKRLLRGQRVERSIELKLSDLSRYGALLDSLVLAGITEIGSVNLAISNRDELVEQALQQAIAKATAKAEVLADGFGRKVAGVYHVDETGGAVVVAERAHLMMDAKAGAQAPVLFGKQSVTANLKVVFLLK